MTGKIIKGIAGFYYVFVVGSGIYECKAKGIFRKLNKKPLVGDDVEIEVLSEEEKTGNISALLPRSSELLRPNVANVDQALVIFAAKRPDPNFNLLDRFLIRMQIEHVPSIICFNKADLLTDEEREELRNHFLGTDYKIFFTSTKNCDENLESSDSWNEIKKLKEELKNKTTTVAGPSGVGKSSLINLFQSKVNMETGDISKKIERGKHTTRHSQLIVVDEHSFIMDTPGFSTLTINELEKEELKDFYPEFLQYENRCRFQGCNHLSEPDCEVKNALESGKISSRRYENYKLLFEELKNIRRY